MGQAESLKSWVGIDKVVGNHLSLNEHELYPELEDVPVVATHSEVNYEKLSQVGPQVVISSVRVHGIVEEQEHLQSFDIQDVKLNLREPHLIKDKIKLLGQVFDKEERAQEIVKFYE